MNSIARSTSNINLLIANRALVDNEEFEVLNTEKPFDESLPECNVEIYTETGLVKFVTHYQGVTVCIVTHISRCVFITRVADKLRK